MDKIGTDFVYFKKRKYTGMHQCQDHVARRVSEELREGESDCFSPPDAKYAMLSNIT
jgi:hypothetical protein